MKENFANFADRAYLHFKKLVGDGRDMDIDVVETLAQRRVWTGEQAKELALVDELGGLQRAIAFAQREYTTSGEAIVVPWPPVQSLRDLVLKKGKEDGDDEDTAIPSLWNFLFSAAAETSKGETLLPFDAFSLGGAGVKLKLPASLSGIMLSADENSAIRCLLENNDMEFPPSFWE